MSLLCEGLTLTVADRVLCRNVTFAPRAGEVWAVLGANGTGKTTLLHALAGLRQPASGRVKWRDAALDRLAAADRARQIGLLLQQEDALFWGTALDYVLLGRFPHMRSWVSWSREDGAIAEEALRLVDLAALRDRTYHTLSGGERQRVRIAQVLAQRPCLYLLDEPLQHLDLKHQAGLLRLVRQLAQNDRATVIMVLHDALWTARVCSHALLIFGDGTTLAGPAGAVATQANLERLHGCALEDVAGAGDRCFLPHV